MTPAVATWLHADPVTVAPVAVVRVSDEARDQWRAFADRHGVSVSALLEAIGMGLPEGELGHRMLDVVAEARAIDVERRRRG